MTALEIIRKRTGLGTEDALYYAEMAEARIASYLSIEGASLEPTYTFQIADIAVLYYQQDTATRNSSASLGYNSHSFSEGGVSETVSGADGQAIWETYARAIDDVLATLDGQPGGVVRFL
jgi:hypothetical protein